MRINNSKTQKQNAMKTDEIKFSDLTSDQIMWRTAAICLPKYAINHLPITKVTDKAICIELDYSSWVHKSIKHIWLPISKINIQKTWKQGIYIDSDLSNDKECLLYFQVDLPEWLLRNNKII